MVKALVLIILAVGAGSIKADDVSLDRKIANMFMLGFEGTEAGMESPVKKDICEKGLGGVILFDRFPGDKKIAKNISSPAQLKKLTKTLAQCDHKPLIAVDEEGGFVQRLKGSAGFYGRYPRASEVAKKGEQFARRVYGKMAEELRRYGINCNLAPVADLALNKDNRVIYKYGRSFGAEPKKVAGLNGIFVRQMHRYRILTAVKHFPGHGSSTGDTHKGFVDVSRQWKKIELEPYKLLIQKGLADSIMVAHIFNKNIDPLYPASLSRKTVTGLLRKKMGYKGVVITDDLQMGAIAQHYSLKERVRLAINAGNDILLFGNQTDRKKRVNLEKLLHIVHDLLKSKAVDKKMIIAANKRINRMKRVFVGRNR